MASVANFCWEVRFSQSAEGLNLKTPQVFKRHILDLGGTSL
jgi:hypothetical protein